MMNLRHIIVVVFLACFSGFTFASGISYNFRKGVEAAQNADFENGKTYLEKEIETNPKNGLAYVWLAVVYGDHNENGEGLNQVNKGLALLPKKDKDNQAFAYYVRGRIYYQMEDTSKAVDDYSKAVKLQPQTDSYLRERAIVYRERKQYALSDADFKKMIEVNPGSFKGYMGLGINASKQKKWQEAIDQYDYVCKLTSSYADVYAYRAEAYRNMGKYNEATDDLISSLKIGYSQSSFDECGKYKGKALTVLLTKLRIQSAKNPNEESWHQYLATAYENSYQYKNAIESLRKAQDAEERAATLVSLSRVYSESGLYTKAMEAAERAIELDSFYRDSVSPKLDVYIRQQKFDKALTEQDTLIAKNPTSADLYNRRAQVKSRKGDYAGALEDIRTSLILKNKSVFAQYELGYCLEKTSQAQDAREAFETALKQAQQDDNRSPVVAYVYAHLGREEEAFALIDSLIDINDASLADKACIYCIFGNNAKALETLKQDFEAGDRDFGMIETDPDLIPLHNTDAYKNLLKEYKAKLKVELADEYKKEADEKNAKEVVSYVPFTRESGVCKVKCAINGLDLHFIFDTGASSVTMSMVEATFMMKNGYLNEKDAVGSQRFMDANGDVSEGTVINLRNVTFGGLNLTNVKATVVRNQQAPLLLGQTVLSRLGKIEIDNTDKKLKITHKE